MIGSTDLEIIEKFKWKTQMKSSVLKYDISYASALKFRVNDLQCVNSTFYLIEV